MSKKNGGRPPLGVALAGFRGYGPLPARLQYHGRKRIGNTKLPGGGFILEDCKSCERMAKAETTIENLKKEAGILGKKLDKLQYWIMTQTAAIAIAVILLLFKGGAH
jgi:hypothetical protein